MAIVGPAITLATSLVNLIATAEAMANLNQLKDYQLELISEDAKGDAADDGKVQDLHAKIAVLLTAVANQYALHIGAPSAAST